MKSNKEEKKMTLFCNYVTGIMKCEIHLQVVRQEMKQLLHVG